MYRLLICALHCLFCAFGPWLALSFLLLCIRLQVGNFFRLCCCYPAVLLVIFFLLGRGQRLILHLQLHRLIDILPFAEPEDKVVTFLQTFCSHACFLIQLCKLISPLFNILRFLELFQRLDLLLHRRSLRTQNLVSQDILVRILGCDLHKIIVIIDSLVYISRLNRKRTQTIEHLTATFRAVIGDSEDTIALLILSIFFINIADIHQHGHIAHPFPINLIRCLGRLVVCAVFHKFKHLFCF